MIILNGGSSSGKTGMARCPQAVLPGSWPAFGIDSLVDALPAALRTTEGGITLADDGGVAVGDTFLTLEAAWREGLAAMVRAGARVIVDDVFLGGATSQERWRKAVAGLEVLRVGVRCAAPVAEGREIARGDRIPGMAARQADSVHRGVVYDGEVDTTRTESLTCARAVAARLGRAEAGKQRVGAEGLPGVRDRRRTPRAMATRHGRGCGRPRSPPWWKR